MNAAIKKFLSDYGILIVVVVGLVVLVFPSLSRYFTSKSAPGHESMAKSDNSAYSDKQPREKILASEPLGQNEVYASVSGSGINSGPGASTGSSGALQNPSDLLPKDTNGQWAQLNPSGKGDLSNINLLKAGYHIGIDTIGSSLRNANLQERSEPPNPQLNVGPWNMSTITSDVMRVPLEIGSGGQ
jgi:hypothetical protein